MLLKSYCVLLFSLIVNVWCYAQPTGDRIQALAKSKKEGVWLRWAPVNPTVWQLGNKYGYVVERFTVLSNGELENQSGEKLTLSPLKPYSPVELEQLSRTVKEADVLLELLYGEDEGQVLKPTDPASVLERNTDLENKFGVALLVCDLSPEVAKAAGLFFADKNAVKGKRYIYRISLAQQPPGGAIAPGVVVVDVTDEKPLIALNDLRVEFRDKAASLSWSTLLHHGIYSYYYIERSEDGETFKKVTDLPYVHMSESPDTETAYFVDSLAVNNKVYYYRVAGVSPFGETGPPSNVVSGQGRDDLSGFLVIREGKALDPATSSKKVSIAWEFPVEAEKQIAGFRVSRASKAGGPYTDITAIPLTKDKREYVDVTTFYNTYYQVSAVDESGKELSRSFPFLVQVEDNTPPAVPVGLSGTIDKHGITQLTWQENKDDDLMGYRIFRSNSLQEEFVELTHTLLTTPAFTDTVVVRVLNKKIYYRAVAVDKNYNASDFSSPLALTKPDVVAPVAPVFTKAGIENGTIALAWINSSSEDVAKVELNRMEKEDQINRVIRTWTPPAAVTEHTEATLTPGKSYQYKLIVYDSSGNTSEGVSPLIYFETGYRQAVTDAKATVDRNARQIRVEWKNTSPAVKCTIYRKRNSEPFVLYQTMEGNIETFTDKRISINNTYSYKVQVAYAKGVKSQLSQEIKVIY